MAKILAAALALALSVQDKKDYGQRPDWSLKGPDGKTISAADFDKKVVIVDFWATWCPPCVKEVPGFIELQKKYKDKGLAILGFSFDQDAKTHDDWVKAKGVNYPSIVVLGDEEKKVVAEFGKQIGEVEALPTTIVIDRTGKIVYKHVGYGSPESFEKVILPLF